LKISIITPNYNYADYIGKTIESVVTQDYDDIEHIIVDDGSTDNSVNIIKHYQNIYPGKIKLIQQENMGQTKAINVGLKNASGQIICWINSDDYYSKNVFGLIVSNFKNNPNIDAIFGDIGIVDQFDKIIKLNKYLQFDYKSGVFNGFGKIISSNAIFWRRRLTDEVGFFDESFEYAMDSEYWSRLLFNRNIKKIKITVAYFRWHKAAKTSKSHIKLSNDYKQVLIEREIIFRKAYKKLKLSKYVPINYSKPFYIFYRLKRLVLRGLLGEYFK